MKATVTVTAGESPVEVRLLNPEGDAVPLPAVAPGTSATYEVGQDYTFDGVRVMDAEESAPVATDDSAADRIAERNANR